MGVEEGFKPLRDIIETAVNDAPPSLPVYAIWNGARVVVLAVDDYKRLLGASLPQPVAKIGRAPRRKPRPLPSTVERDAEVATFLRSQFAAAATIDTAHAACLEHFGTTRTPSKNRIGAFRTKVRREP